MILDERGLSDTISATSGSGFDFFGTLGKVGVNLIVGLTGGLIGDLFGPSPESQETQLLKESIVTNQIELQKQTQQLIMGAGAAVIAGIVLYKKSLKGKKRRK